MTAPGHSTPAERAAALGTRLDALLATDAIGDMCDLVVVAFTERSDAGDLPEIAALVSALPDTDLAAHPSVLLELARACDAEARVRLRSRLLDRADRLPTTSADFAIALEAERIVDLARDTRADEVEARVAALRRRLDRAESSTLTREARTRSSYALGRVLSWRGDPLSLASAEDALQVAVGTARELRRDEWRAQALLTLGYGVYFERGEEVRATQRLREAIDLLPRGHPRRAGISTFLAEVFVRSHLGGAAETLLREIRDEAAQTGDQRSLGYAAWIMMLLSAERGDRAATLEWLAETERHPGDWFEHSTGSEFLAEAAVSAERVGEVALADRYLERATRRAVDDGYPEVAWFATGMINARRGDAALAVTELSKLLDEPWLPARDAWAVWLHLALARLRSGDELGAGQDAARGFEGASALVGPGRAAATRADLGGLLTRLEAELVRRLAPLAAAAGDDLAAAVHPVSPRIRLLGGLAVRVGATTIAVPEGRPAQLLMLLATARGPVAVDVAIEELWPQVSGEVGRRRMRNVVARLRASCGDLVTRVGDSFALTPGTVVDIAEFEQAAARVDRALPSERLALARAALALYQGELLPEAAYTPRVVSLRDELDTRAIGLLEVMAASAEQALRVDDAIQALNRIAALDPYDEAVLRRGGAVLRAAGRTQQAAEWESRADSVAAD
ncbi:MAG: BTAD domain-containing putative transcriptional regulator [Jatrophihabitans sp.]